MKTINADITKYNTGDWVIGWDNILLRLEKENEFGYETNCIVSGVRQNISEESIVRLARKDELEKLKGSMKNG